MNFNDKVIAYLFNKQNRLDDEYNELLNNFRYRKNDQVDYLELIIAKSRCDLFNEVSCDILNLKNIKTHRQLYKINVVLAFIVLVG